MSDRPNLFTRPDTFLGTCQAVGDDLGFNANWLRMAIALPLLWMPVWSVVAYATLTLVVLASRLIFPARDVAAVVEPVTAPDVANEVANDGAPMELARAA